MFSNKKNPVVSIIIPSYNHEKYLEFAIKSVMGQTFKDWELIVVDDGSTDSSVEIIKKYTEIDNRIKLVVQENQDAPNAINKGIKEAQGEYISILNSDDAFETIKIKESIDALSRGADFVFGKIKVIDENNTEITAKNERVDWINDKLNNSKEPPSLEKLVKNINYVVTTTNFVFKKDIIKKVGFFHEKLHYGHDYNFLIRAYEAGVKISFIPSYHNFYRIHSQNTISKGFEEALLEAAYSISKLYRGKSDMVRDIIIEDRVILNILSYMSKLSEEDLENVVRDKKNKTRIKIVNTIKKNIYKIKTYKLGITFIKKIFKIFKEDNPKELIIRITNKIFG